MWGVGAGGGAGGGTVGATTSVELVRVLLWMDGIEQPPLRGGEDSRGGGGKNGEAGACVGCEWGRCWTLVAVGGGAILFLFSLCSWR